MILTTATMVSLLATLRLSAGGVVPQVKNKHVDCGAGSELAPRVLCSTGAYQNVLVATLTSEETAVLEDARDLLTNLDVWNKQ